jgi:outer membrane protein assembly factor BamB
MRKNIASTAALLLALSMFVVALLACDSNFSTSSTNSTRVKSVSPRALVLIDAKTGEIDRNFHDTNLSADVVSAVSDGEGGWYIGGGFTRVGGETRRGIAHLRSDSSLEPAFVPELIKGDGADALLLRGNVLYAGGHQNGVVALDARSGKLLWRTSTSGDPVLGIAYRSGILYVNGNFSRIGGVARAGIAALNPANGKTTPWQVHLSGSGDGRVTIGVMAVANGAVYLGGYFARVDGVKRELGLAAVSPRTGRPTAWAPRARGTSLDSFDSILVTHGQVLVGSVVYGFAAFSARTGYALPWSKRLAGGVSSFALTGDTVYLGGVPHPGFNRVGGKPANNLASVVLPEGRFTDWRPNVDRCTIVRAMAVSGRKLLVAGYFSPNKEDC